jgi:antitoxin VapB
MRTAKLFRNGQSQAVRLPKEFRLPGDEVYITRRRDAVVLIPKTGAWDGFVRSLGMFSDDFMEQRDQPPPQEREGL